MTELVIRKATEKDTTSLNAALRELSEYMGDEHPITDENLKSLMFGERPHSEALLAEKGGELVGVCLFAPFISTNLGGLAVYVSDLWVHESMRGQGLGPKLMAAVVDLWGDEAKFIRLSVYNDNPKARDVYLRLGFKGEAKAEFLQLYAEDFKNIRQSV